MGTYDPNKSIATMMEGTLRRSSHVRRYASVPVQRVENVAEHTFYVGIYSNIIALRLEFEFVKIDWKKLMTSTMFHDCDEFTSGDVLREVKRHSQELYNAWTAMCETFVHQLERDLDINIFSFWKQDKDLTCIEGQILALCDFLSVASYCLEEYDLGNHKLLEVVKNCREHIYDLHHKIPELCNAMDDVFIDVENYLDSRLDKQLYTLNAL